MKIGEACCISEPITNGWVVLVAVVVLGQGVSITIFDGFDLDADAKEFASYQKSRILTMDLKGIKVREISVKKNEDILNFSNVKIIARTSIQKLRHKWKQI